MRWTLLCRRLLNLVSAWSQLHLMRLCSVGNRAWRQHTWVQQFLSHFVEYVLVMLALVREPEALALLNFPVTAEETQGHSSAGPVSPRQAQASTSESRRPRDRVPAVDALVLPALGVGCLADCLVPEWNLIPCPPPPLSRRRASRSLRVGLNPALGIGSRLALCIPVLVLFLCAAHPEASGVSSSTSPSSDKLSSSMGANRWGSHFTVRVTAQSRAIAQCRGGRSASASAVAVRAHCRPVAPHRADSARLRPPSAICGRRDAVLPLHRLQVLQLLHPPHYYLPPSSSVVEA